jgi:hypothetical protein
MNIDERLEALTQSLELLAHMHTEFERETGQKIQALAIIAEQTLDSVRRLAQHARATDESIARLAHIVEAHERRISGLEGQ